MNLLIAIPIVLFFSVFLVYIINIMDGKSKEKAKEKAKEEPKEPDSSGIEHIMKAYKEALKNKKDEGEN